jgi:hypothetical protein
LDKEKRLKMFLRLLPGGHRNCCRHLSRYLFFVVPLLIFSCKSQPQSTAYAVARTNGLSDSALLDTVEKQTFKYFWDAAEPNSGMGCERVHVDNNYPEHDQHIVTTGGSGFGIMGLIAGIERGYITRQQGLERFGKIVSFLEKADRFHGAWSHWIDGETGHVKPFGRVDNGGDLVETSFLLQGLLCVRQYFKDGNDEEKHLAARIDTLWRQLSLIGIAMTGMFYTGIGVRNTVGEKIFLFTVTMNA